MPVLLHVSPNMGTVECSKFDRAGSPAAKTPTRKLLGLEDVSGVQNQALHIPVKDKNALSKPIAWRCLHTPIREKVGMFVAGSS
jgi:hypothetical protein